MPRRTEPAPSHFAVFAFADFGHISPTLGPARELIARGHRVTYVVDERFAPVVEATGARAVTYTSARGAFYRAADPTPDQLAADGVDLLRDTINTVFPLAMSAFAQDPPDLVLYDFETMAPARVAARLLGAVPVQFGPSHAANEAFPLRAQLWDADNALMREGAAALIEFMGAHGIGLDEMGRFCAEWDERNLAFLPREFQVEGDTFDDRYAFVGPVVTEADPGVWTPPNDGRRVALVSLGTESHGWSGWSGFFRACGEAFDADDWHVVMTLGRGADRSLLEPLPGHVEVHEWLPHTAVLPHADVVVCHAGMCSLMEALYYGVPVVAAPRAHELSLSARRLEECGVGRTLPRDGVTASLLADTVTELLADPATPGCLDRMRTAVRGAGGAPRAADMMERWAGQREGQRAAAVPA
ncbi:glycosyl transferase [Streptomyces montanus]|uniref:Glycosyl transferase n=1 Tax=Streptomyces montanus TaxID=2580423 RepID=A0A5R9G885_9ACTN|nr:macrolide family glycosyltransferase [Streptomyces montanus]TLS47685.1 glycosyl transferase [Streptomyces montanus]